MSTLYGRWLIPSLRFCISDNHSFEESTVVYSKISPITGPRCPEGSRKLRFPDYVTMAQDGGTLSALRTGRFLTPGNTTSTHFC